MTLRCLSEPKSKLGLPRVTMGLNEPLNQSPRGGLENIGYTSINGPPGNCYKRHVQGRQNRRSTEGFPSGWNEMIIKDTISF